MSPINTHALYQASKQLFQQNINHVFFVDGLDCIRTTCMPNVRVHFQKHAHQFISVHLDEPRLILNFSGSARVSSGQSEFVIDPENGLLVTTPLTINISSHATEKNPLVGIQILLSQSDIKQLLFRLYTAETKLGKIPPPQTQKKGNIKVGIEKYPLNESLKEKIWILIQTIRDPVSAELFGQERVNAVIAALLQSPSAGLLRSLIQKDGLFLKFKKAIRYIHEHDGGESISLEELTNHAGMSASSLNRAFKTYTTDSPLQYIKKMRLNQGKALISQGNNIQDAAFQVGYESASQFSREYKRYFNQNPKANKRNAHEIDIA